MASNGISVPVHLDVDLSDLRKEGQAMGNILERSLNRNTRTRALDNLEKQINSARKRLGKLREAYEDLFRRPAEHPELFTEDMTKAYNVAKQLDDEVRKIVADYKKVHPEHVDFSNQQILGAFKSSKAGKDFGAKQVIKEWEKAKQAVQDLIDTGRAFTLDNAPVQRLTGSLEQAEQRLQELLERYRELSYYSGNSIQNALQPMVNFNQEISQTANTFRQAFGPYIQIATTAMSAFVEVTKLEIKAMTKLGSLALSVFKPLISMVKLATKAFKSMFNNIKKHNESTLKNLWRYIMMYGIGARSLYFLVRKIRNLLGDLINELAKQVPEVNDVMSKFMTAVNGVKGALASAFQPILTTVLPLLTTLMKAVSQATTTVAKFIALLTGQDYIYEATATEVDYAKSLEKTGSAAKKAKKDLEGYLSPIDEINKFQKKKDNDDDDNGDESAFSLKKVPIENSIKDFWDRIKQAWEHADFTKLGKMLGDKLAEMLAKIPWDAIRAKADQLGQSLATLLNGIMYGEFDGKSLATYIGETIAQAINTAFEFVNGFVKRFDFKELGKSIMEAIAGFLNTLDWNLITGALARLGTGIGQTLAEIFKDTETWAAAGDALGRAINALIYMIYNIFNQLDGKQIGAAISSFLNGAIDRIDTKAFATTCNEIMNDLLDALNSAIEGTKWDELGTKLAEAFVKIDFKGIFKKTAKLASNIVDAILDVLESFLDGLTQQDLEDIGTSIADAINGLDFQPERLGTVADNLLNALLTIAKTAVENIKWDELADKIKTLLEQIDWKGKIEQATEIVTQLQEGFHTLLDGALRGIFGDIGANCIEGLLAGIKEAVTAILLGPVLAPFHSIIKAIKQLFGIHSPSTVFKEIGDMIVQGFINGIQTIVQKASKVWNDLKTNTVQMFQNIWSGIKGVINSILGGVEKMVNGIINAFNSMGEKLGELDVDIPDWVPGVGGNHFELRMPKLGTISIPRLAQGAVIPPNKQFMAMLGDQKQGTNIETPLSTMIEAFNTALAQNGGGNQSITLNLMLPDRRTVAQYAIEGGQVIQMSRGVNPFLLERG